MTGNLVSVVLCTYNGDRFLDGQLESICKQTYPHLEIVIFDDASTDSSYSLLHAYAQRDSRIRLSRNETNLGFNLNFSAACKVATGDFIAIADQDDIWEPDKITILMEKMESDPQNMLVHCMSARFEKFGKFHLKSHRFVNYHSGNDVKNFFLINFISGHNMLLRRCVVEGSMPFPKGVYYDWWLCVNASLNGRVVPVSRVLVWHRMHDSNATGAAKPKVLFYKQAIANLTEFRKIGKLSTADRDFAATLLIHFEELSTKNFSRKLYRFLLKHAPVLYAHKKRRMPWAAHLKHAFRHAHHQTLA